MEDTNLTGQRTLDLTDETDGLGLQLEVDGCHGEWMGCSDGWESAR